MATRTLDVRMPLAQVSLTTLILCAVAGSADPLGYIDDISFEFLNWKRLEEKPQSKLDWTLRALR